MTVWEFLAAGLVLLAIANLSKVGAVLLDLWTLWDDLKAHEWHWSVRLVCVQIPEAAIFFLGTVICYGILSDLVPVWFDTIVKAVTP